MNNLKTIIIICTLLLLSCSKDKNKSITNIPTYEINLDSLKTNKVGNISSYFKSVKLIALETSDINLIKSIDAVQVKDDYIFILDRSYKRLYCFDKNGKFIRRIGSVGPGPGEYSSISDFTIDNDGIIYLLDRHGYKILSYNLLGEYKHSISIKNIDGNSGHIQNYKNTLYLDFQPKNINSKEDNPLLFKIDKITGELLDKYLSSDNYNLGFKQVFFRDGSFFYSKGNDIPCYAPPYSNTVFSLKDSVEPYFTIKSNRLLEKEDIKHLNLTQPFAIANIGMIDKIKSILNFNEVGDKIFCKYSDGHKFKTIIYSKMTREGVILEKLFDDFVYKSLDESIPHHFGCAVENGLYSYINVDDFFYFVDYYKSGKLNIEIDQSLKDLFNEDITEESNPILFFYELN